MNTQTGRSGTKPHIRALNSDEAMPPAEKMGNISREVSRKFDAWLERRGFVKPTRNWTTNK